jgi:hypothetical protein
MAFGFTYTLPTITGSHSDFPVLLKTVDFPSAAIDGTANAIDNGGGNLRAYTSDTKTTQLPVDVVVFVSSGSPEAIVWVKIPTAATSSTIYIEADSVETSQPAVGAAFGRNSVWSDFELIIHSGTTTDSAGNHSPSVVGSPSLSPVAWGDGYQLNTSAEYVQIPHATALNIEKNYSIDLWINPQFSPTTSQVYVDKVNSSNSNGFRMLPVNNSLRTRHPNLSSPNLDGTDTASITKRISSDMDGTTRRNIKDGVQLSSDTPTGTVTTNTEDLYIGHSIAFTGDDFEGTLGDFWLSKTSRSVAVKLTEYDNQSSVGAWGTVGTWADSGGGGISITGTTPNYSLSAISASIDLTGSIDITGTTPNYSFASIAGSVDLTGEVLVTGQTPNYNYSPIAGSVDLTALIHVVGQTPNYNYAGVAGSVEFTGEISITGSTPNYSFSAIKGLVLVGDAQTIGTVAAGFADSGITSSFKESDITVQYNINSITVNFKD